MVVAIPLRQAIPSRQDRAADFKTEIRRACRHKKAGVPKERRRFFRLEGSYQKPNIMVLPTDPPDHLKALEAQALARGTTPFKRE